MRTLQLDAGAAAQATPVIRIRMPWLTAVAGEATFHRLSAGKLRVTGDGPATSFDLDAEGIVTYQPGRLRISH